jgi:hypothetical protein
MDALEGEHDAYHGRLGQDGAGRVGRHDDAAAGGRHEELVHHVHLQRVVHAVDGVL